MVFHGSGDDMLSPLAKAFDGAENGPVVGLGAAGGEEHPVRFRTHGSSHRMAGNSQLPPGFDAEGIQGGGVGPVFGQCFGHGLHSLGTGLGGGRIV